MDNWKIVMFCLVISVLGLTISNTSQKREIEELQTTVTRQSNAIQQLEKEKNNVETIDWEQRRYEIAKELFPSLLNVGEKFNVLFAAKLAIDCADTLINKLKETKEGK